MHHMQLSKKRAQPFPRTGRHEAMPPGTFREVVCEVNQQT